MKNKYTYESDNSPEMIDANQRLTAYYRKWKMISNDSDHLEIQNKTQK